MSTLLEEFYNGLFSPRDDWNPMDVKGYRENYAKVERLQNQLMKVTGEKYAQQWDDYICAMGSLAEVAYQLIFEKSFSMGAKLMQEVAVQTKDIQTLKEPDLLVTD